MNIGLLLKSWVLNQEKLVRIMNRFWLKIYDAQQPSKNNKLGWRGLWWVLLLPLKGIANE